MEPYHIIYLPNLRREDYELWIKSDSIELMDDRLFLKLEGKTVAVFMLANIVGFHKHNPEDALT